MEFMYLKWWLISTTLSSSAEDEAEQNHRESGENLKTIA